MRTVLQERGGRHKETPNGELPSEELVKFEAANEDDYLGPDDPAPAGIEALMV